MTPTSLCAVIVGMLFCFVPPRVLAQVADTIPYAQLERAARQHWTIRVMLIDSSTVEGTVRNSRGNFLVGGSKLRPPVLSVERRYQEGGSSLIGGVVGALVLGAIGNALSSQGDVANSGEDRLLTTASLAGFGAVLGLFVGNIADPGSTRWERVWPNAVEQDKE